MTVITTTMTTITEMARGRMEAVPLDNIFGQPTLHSVRHLVEQITTFASHLATTKWGGKHGFLPLVLSEAKMRPADGNSNLECKHIKKPELLNQIIEDITKGREILQFQAEQKIEWQEYTLQEVVDLVSVESTVAAVDAQYIEETKEDYVGYKK